MEWGALWIREWRDGVTHVIVDKELIYRDVLKALTITSLPVRILFSGLENDYTNKTVQCHPCQRSISNGLPYI